LCETGMLLKGEAPSPAPSAGGHLRSKSLFIVRLPAPWETQISYGVTVIFFYEHSQQTYTCRYNEKWLGSNIYIFLTRLGSNIGCWNYTTYKSSNQDTVWIHERQFYLNYRCDPCKN
jgi:hypothetical protein